MRQQGLDAELAAAENRVDDQAIAILPDVEHEQSVYEVCIRKGFPHGSKVGPIRMTGGAVPSERFSLYIRCRPLQEFQQVRLADDVHEIC